jgi:ribosomal protein L11 methyltransferase
VGGGGRSPAGAGRGASGPERSGLIRLAVRCRPELAARVLGQLVELAPNGVEEASGEGWVEYALYGPPGEVPNVGELAAAAGDGAVEVSTTEIPDDWGDRWRDFHRAVTIGGRLVVRPSWDEGGREGADLAVVVDPGQAFGTGAHATTRMCLELLLELADRGAAGGPLSDLGTGSGVLAIAAAKLGWGPVAGFDHERSALDAAAENARANGVELELGRANLRDELPELAPTVVANLTGPLLREVAGRLERVPERLICSGLLVSEQEQVEEAFAARELAVSERRREGDWAALLSVRSATVSIE